MDGADGLAPGSAHRRVVRLSDGTLLNRYWDDRDVPREEAYREDVATAAAATETAGRRCTATCVPRPRAVGTSAPAGSADGQTLATIRTTDLVPVDLNSVMAQLESSLAAAHAAAGAVERARALEERAERRKAALQRYFWDEERGMFTDYLWREDKRSDALTAATVAPLFFGLATAPQARRVAAAVRAHAAVAGRSRHLHCSFGPAMGRAQRLGAAAVDGDRGPAPLRRDRAGRDHRRALDDQGDRRLSRRPASWSRSTTSPTPWSRPAAGSTRRRTASGGPTACCAGCSPSTRIP